MVFILSVSVPGFCFGFRFGFCGSRKKPRSDKTKGQRKAAAKQKAKRTEERAAEDELCLVEDVGITKVESQLRRCCVREGECSGVDFRVIKIRNPEDYYKKLFRLLHPKLPNPRSTISFVFLIEPLLTGTLILLNQ